MPRKITPRKIVKPPGFKSFKPNVKNLNPAVELLYEEYEAIKLADYDNLHHIEAAKLMGISRATFARIYETARKKIAKALVEVREIKTIFGNACFDKDWHICSVCKANFNFPNRVEEKKCPMCGSLELKIEA